MSSLVFVRDAQGRPLMPMSAAYARTLMKQGKAQVWPHPAFSVIQLTRTVAAPILRPVLVGIALSTSIADLVIVVDQLRSAPSTIQISVDLRFPLSSSNGQREAWQRHRRRIPSPRIGPLPYAVDHIRILLAALRICHSILPMSHLVLVPSGRTTGLTPPYAWWIEQRLAAAVRGLSPAMMVAHRHTRLSGEAPDTLTGYLIERTAWAARQAPQFVAGVVPRHEMIQRERSYGGRRRWNPQNQVRPHMTADSYGHHRGQMCTVRLQQRTMTGLVQAVNLPDQLMLRVPFQVDDQGVQWHVIHVPLSASLHVWPSTPSWVLPLSKEGH